MGSAKRLLEKEWEQGFHSTGKTACAECVGNEHLEHLVDRSSVGECSYCGAEVPVAEVDVVIAYEDGTDAPWDSEDKEYQIPTYLISDVLSREFSGDLFASDELEKDLAGALEGRMWIQKDWQILNRREGLNLSWREFCDAVKHRTRYLFFEPESTSGDEDPEYVGPAGMLSTLGSLIDEYGLTKTVRAGARFFRVRCDNIVHTSPNELGPPHLKKRLRVG